MLYLYKYLNYKMKEVREVLTESSFTKLCKNGFIQYKTEFGLANIIFNSPDIRLISSGEVVTKQVDNTIFKFALQDIGLDVIRDIIMRSPIYSDIAREF